MAFFVLPNGDIVFETEYSQFLPHFSRIRIYSAKDKSVRSIRLNGKGDNLDSEVDFKNCRVHGTSFLLSEKGELVQGFINFRHEASYAGCLSTKMGHLGFSGFDMQGNLGKSNLPSTHPSISPHFMQGMDQKIYQYTRSTGQVAKFDGQRWVPLISGSHGQCEDGTLAVECATDIFSLFVTKKGEVFFLISKSHSNN